MIDRPSEMVRKTDRQVLDDMLYKATKAKEETSGDATMATNGGKAATSKGFKDEVASDPEGSHRVMPTPGFVIKTKRLSDGTKVFLNICHSPLVSKLVTGAARVSLDKEQKECVAYDAMVHNAFFEQTTDNAVKHQLCLHVIQVINTTYTDDLDASYKLPKMKKGFVGDALIELLVPEASYFSPSSEQEAHAPPSKSGWLVKQGHIRQSSKSRWFHLDSGFLSYYVDESKQAPFGRELKKQMCVFGYRVVDTLEVDASSGELSFALEKAGESVDSFRGFEVEGQPEELYMTASSPAEKQQWISALQAHVEFTLVLARGDFRQKNSSNARTRDSIPPLTLADAQWIVFLRAEEALMGQVLSYKKNPMGSKQARHILLTASELSGCRMMYIDPKSMELKGEFFWNKNKPAEASEVTSDTFQIKAMKRDESGEGEKELKFTIAEDQAHNASDWVKLIRKATFAL